jgi:hypothetical protein
MRDLPSFQVQREDLVVVSGGSGTDHQEANETKHEARRDAERDQYPNEIKDI